MYKKFSKILALMLVICMFFLVSCSNSEGDKSSTADKEQETTTGDDSKDETKDQQPADTADPFGKYDPPIEVTTVRIVDDTYKYAEGDSIEKNIWTDLYEKELGIKIKNQWVVSGGSQGEQKMNVSIASGDLPEIIPVNAVQLAQLVDADMLMDLEDVYEKYAAPFTKDVMTQEGNDYFNAATFGGKLMAIPNTGSTMDGAPMIWVREDWRKKLNLPEPKTMADVLKISEEFTKKDPDGNGKNDTIGIAVTKDIYGGYAGLEGFFNGYHAYPNIWIKDESGQIVYGSIQPEVKVALQKLQELYKDGQIDKEFGVKDGGKVAELSASGKNGLEFGAMWNPLWPLQDNKSNDENAEWQAYSLSSVDDEPAKPQSSLAVGQFFAVKKGTKHPEAIVKLVNLFIEKGWGETADPGQYFTCEGVERHKYALGQAWPARKNLDAHLHILEANQKGDTSILNAEELDYNTKIERYKKGEKEFWGVDRVFGETGSFTVINKYVNDNLIKVNEFYGAPTPTQVEKGTTLSKMEVEVFTKIIMGDPIENFDKFVNDWKKLGGDNITKEINEWASKK